MAKKTAKKEPAKASTAKATKAPAKPATKVASKAAQPVKATKTEKATDKKVRAGKKSAPVKTAAKAAGKKTASAIEKQSIAVKAKVVQVVDETVEVKPAKAAEVKLAKATKPAKVTEAEKKAVKITRDQTKVLTEDYKKWLEFQDRHGDERPQKYTMSGQFEAQKPIEHPKFGWGFVISNIEDRLEVLFDSGVRFLISNRKS